MIFSRFTWFLVYLVYKIFKLFKQSGMLNRCTVCYIVLGKFGKINFDPFFISEF